MPRTKKVKVVESEEIKLKTDVNVLETLNKLSDAVLGLSKKIDALEERQKTLPLVLPGSKLDVVSPADAPVAAQVVPIKTAPEFPVPYEFREKTDLILNKNFGLRVLPRSDSPDFEFVVVVPDKYSPATPAQKQVVGGSDIRVKVFNRAEGVNGVQEYLKLVYDSFSNETRALISADRNQ